EGTQGRSWIWRQAVMPLGTRSTSPWRPDDRWQFPPLAEEDGGVIGAGAAPAAPRAGRLLPLALPCPFQDKLCEQTIDPGKPGTCELLGILAGKAFVHEPCAGRGCDEQAHHLSLLGRIIGGHPLHHEGHRPDMSSRGVGTADTPRRRPFIV